MMLEGAEGVREASRPAVARAWDVVLRWLRVLWVCRVSATSAGLGVALFALASPARDLFMEIQDYRLYWTAFFALVLAWSVIVHYAAHKVLEQQAWATRGESLPAGCRRLKNLVACYRLPAAWIPRILGLLCLYAVWLGVTGAAEDLAPARQALDLPDPTRLLWFLAVVTAAYIAYLVLHRRLVDQRSRDEPWTRYLRDLLTGENESLLVEPNPFWFFELATRAGRRSRRTGRWDGVAVTLLLSLAIVWIVAVIWPWLVEVATPRALFVILMLSLPVSLLAFLSVLSHHLRFPLIAGLVLLFSILSGAAPTFHDLRQVEGRAVTRLSLTDAVDRWERLNCPPERDRPRQACTARPVIIASAGGASRAAFFTASVVGDIIDDGRIDLRRRLFAISGVSGGSVGAVVVRAALEDAGADGRAPCRRVGRSWFRFQDDPKPPYSWRVCLQALTAGDFLSRPFVGLAFRDLFGFPFHLLGMSDRAALLEKAFEDQYQSLVDPDGEALAGLGRAVGEFPHGEERWVPLLVLNTTSVLDGRRSIVSDLLTYSCKGSTVVPLFPAAVDLLDTLSSGRGCATGRPAQPAGSPAVRLSTGATASARFPVISPHASIRRSEGEVDLVVDGGYFENDGLTSARQLAEAMQAIRPDLPRPVILHVTNNPTSESVGDPDVAPRSRRDQNWYDAFGAPLAALAATRDGHAAEAMKAARASPAVEAVLSFQVSDIVPSRAAARACSLSSERKSNSGNGHVDRIKDLSMSWWLSGAVQAYLDSQVCDRTNGERYGDLIRLVGDKAERW